MVMAALRLALERLAQLAVDPAGGPLRAPATALEVFAMIGEERRQVKVEEEWM